MSRPFTEAELEAYLDEALPAPLMASMEDAIRQDAELAAELVRVHARRDTGVHTLGAIWRRRRVSCPSRGQLGSFVLKALPKPVYDYIAFHVQEVGCRYCQASLSDLESQKTEAATQVAVRRRKFFQSSAGGLRKGE